MKRIYKDVAIYEAKDGYGVALDQRPLKTPAKNLLTVPAQALAERVVAEWRAQEEEIRHETMPLTRLVCTALDGVALRRDEVIDATARYAETDLLCYRVEEPPVLVKRQHEAWQPLLDWARARYGAELRVTTALLPIGQEEASLARLREAVAELDTLSLTALHFVVAACGSLVIALALLEEEIDAETAWSISQIDESWQSEQWGEDQELAERREALKGDIASAAELMALLRAK